jgi:endonuclease/exonuclease/phosphatase family metal-dependent hydrolase
VHYNAHGNGLTDWSTNVAQVQALGRQLKYLDPDIVTLNEVPYGCTWQVPDFVAAYLPGYSMATNSGTDGYIRSVVLSRFPIRFSQKWLDGSSLAAFGYNGNFTRDLFQAQVAVPDFARPLDVFVTHLKAMSTQDSANKRAAEAGAVSNFFAVTYLRGTNALNPYLLAGDLNEDIFRPETNRYTSGLPIQRLVNPTTGLELSTPVNPLTRDDRTLSIQTTLDVRFDYILPGGLLYSNIVSSEVFRTDVLTNVPAGLLADDDKTASDHLPVLMVFSNPYDQPFRLISMARSNQNAAFAWQSVRGQTYQVEHSADLVTWSVLASNVVATNARCEFGAPASQTAEFFRVYRIP